MNLCPGPSHVFRCTEVQGAPSLVPRVCDVGFAPQMPSYLSYQRRAPLVSDWTHFLCIPEAQRPVLFPALTPNAFHHSSTHRKPGPRGSAISRPAGPIQPPSSASPSLCSASPPLIFLIFILSILLFKSSFFTLSFYTSSFFHLCFSAFYNLSLSLPTLIS